MNPQGRKSTKKAGGRRMILLFSGVSFSDYGYISICLHSFSLYAQSHRKSGRSAFHPDTLPHNLPGTARADCRTR